MSASHTATTTPTSTTLSDSLGRSSVTPCNLDTNRDYNHAVYGSHMSPSVGSLHYALPQQPQPPPRTLIPSGNDGGSSSAQQQQTDPQMFRPQTHDLSQHQTPRSAGKRRQQDVFGEDKSNKRKKQGSGSFGGVDGDDGANGEGHGAKHWTDEEKNKFFIWLLGSDEHWDAFSTKMNTCFRECAQSIFGGRKTFTALKSCYHRNLETFKQLSTFEQFNGPLEAGIADPSNQNERQVHFEKRLENARTAGCHIGNLSPRIIDSWLRNGWYDLFKNRFYGDPNRPLLVMQTVTPPHHQVGDSETQLPDTGPDPSPEPSQSVHLPPESPNLSNGNLGAVNRHPMLPPQPPPPPPPLPNFQTSQQVLNPACSSAADQTVAHLTALTQNLIATYAHMVQFQLDDNREKLDLKRRKEEREEEDSRLRRESEKRREEREVAEWESTKEREKIKQKADLATQLLSNPDMDPSIKQAAGDYLKQLFAF